MYTLLETAELHDVDPAEYVAAVIDADSRGEILFPWKMSPSGPAVAPIGREHSSRLPHHGGAVIDRRQDEAAKGLTEDTLYS